jgi:threonylcarbamoyladenosine tRNA methylthiotransferase MtaB
MPTVSFHTLGCKLNFAETSSLGHEFLSRGFSVVQSGTPADVCVINTCSVTARADRECRQLIRRARRVSPGALVVVTGCYAQLEPGEVAAIEGVDVVLGAKEKFEIFDHISGLEKKLYPHVAVSEIGTVNSFGVAHTSEVGGRTRAFLKIQDGCDYNCTFCTIPLARGASRSQGVEASLEQVRRLTAEGYKEVVLTGVNVGDYGRKDGWNLISLLKELVAVDSLARIRISSIEPNLLSREIIDFVAANDKMCKHFHIPLQSGSDAILRAMRRRYTTRHYAEVVECIRRTIPDCGIGVDVIVGFPGETGADFESTQQFIDKLPVSYLHVFTYSARPQTLAASFAGQVEPKVRFRRNEVLRLLGQKKKRAFYESMTGKVADVLAEADVVGDLRYGFTSNYVRVAMSASLTSENAIVPVLLTGIDNDVCCGQLLGQEVEV